MFYLFGHRLGTIGRNAMFTTTNDFMADGVNVTAEKVNSNYLRINPGDFIIGSNINTLMELKVGDVLTNRSGDSLEVIEVSSSVEITAIRKGIINIVSGNYKGTYPFDYSVNQQFLTMGIKETADEYTLENWRVGSYMFTYTDDEGSIYIGHPTRVHKDLLYLSPNDTAGGVVKITNDDIEIVMGNNTPSDYVWSTFAIFCAREITTQAPDDDPLKPGGDSETGGGDGDFNGSSDTILLPNLPHLSAVNTGFITLYNPSLVQLRELSAYMWSDLFSTDTVKKLFADPMDVIIGLSIIPVRVPFAGSQNVKVGGIETDITMNIASEQFIAFDCGSLDVGEFWGAYLDFDPYTKIEIYLPYIGVKRLSTDDVMGKTVNVTYHIDILSGSCCAIIRCNGSVTYTFSGQCSTPIPINGSDWLNVISGALGVASSAVSTLATGGALAPLAVASTASAVNSTKPSIEKSGNMGGTSGMLGVQTPYLILTRPRQAKPSYQSKYMGYPSFITSKLGNVSGYTEIESIRLDNIPATRDELTEIETLLKSGVIF